MKPAKKDKLYIEIRSILEDARKSAYRAVNFTMVLAYWEVGRLIVAEEQKGNKRAGYGEALVKDLSLKLTAYFGKGFSVVGLKNYRQFYLAFSESSKGSALRSLLPDTQQNQKSSALRSLSKPSAVSDELKKSSGKNSIRHALRSELSWTHYRLLMRVENQDARNYYINEAIEENWSTRTLERQINSFYYERILSSKNKKKVKEDANKAEDNKVLSAVDFIKDPYVFEFLGLSQRSSWLEKDLEEELINKLQFFLLELGKGFSFVSRQKRITVDGEHFSIDLVFYNYLLKCFLLIDLKLGKLTHQDIGQIDMYVRYWEDNEKPASDNPTIGIILCSEKNDTIVKYSVLKGSRQLFASKYKLYLPTEEELKQEIEYEIMQYKLNNPNV